MTCSLEHEKQLRARGFSIIAGIDEAGRGPLAGPVVAAAVILPIRYRHKVLRDSKQLNHKQREKLYDELVGHTEITWAAAAVEVEEIDRINILRATHAAMRLAMEQLAIAPDHVLIDGLPVRDFPRPQTALVKGDAISFSIAAASIIAKVTRDRLMLDLDRQYPAYGFAQHKGYSTGLHLERLRQHGPCPIHRRTFLPVRLAQLTLEGI